MRGLSRGHARRPAGASRPGDPRLSRLQQVVQGALGLLARAVEDVLEAGAGGIALERLLQRVALAGVLAAGVLAAQVLAGGEEVLQRGALLAFEAQADGGERRRLVGAQPVLVV